MRGTTKMKRPLAFLLAVTYVGTVMAANWAVSTLDPVTVWPWPRLAAPAGVLFAGLAFTLRDLLHELAGPWIVLTTIGIGAVVSLSIASPGFVFASTAAFACSELIDMAVYTPLRLRGRWLPAVVASNTVGLVADSALFLWLAFGSLAFFWGQTIGKLWLTLAAVAVLAIGRRAWQTWRAAA